MLSSGVISFSKTIFLISIMTAFILIEMRLTKRKMHYAFKDNKAKISRISHQIINQTVRYISIKFFISLSTGILCGLASLIIGLDFPIVWGFLAFIMNFIPIFGSIISVGFTTLFSLLQFYPNWGKTVFVLVFMTSVNMILGNILEPRIEGKNLGISPVMILISLSLWGYIWGFTGMLLAVPLMVIIKIVCENIDYLKGLAIIIGNDPRQQFQAQAQSQDKLENETLDSAQTETQPDSETN
jgi:predicted PurR-regulated permease PerM